MAHVGVQFTPIGAVFPAVYVAIKTVQFGVVDMHPVEDAGAVVATQVQVLQPHQVALPFGAADDGFHICDAGKDGGDETGGLHSCFVELTHGLQPPFDTHAAIHLAAEVLVERVDAPRHAGIGEGLDQVKVAQHEVALGGDADADAAALQLFQQSTCALVFGFAGLIAVRHRPKESLLAGILARVLDVGPHFHIHKVAPRLRVVGESFHERGIAVFAGMGTAHVRVHREVCHRQVRLRHYALCLDLFDNHSLF